MCLVLCNSILAQGNRKEGKMRIELLLISSMLLSDLQVLVKIPMVYGEKGPAFLFFFSPPFSFKGLINLGHEKKRHETRSNSKQKIIPY